MRKKKLLYIIFILICCNALYICLFTQYAYAQGDIEASGFNIDEIEILENEPDKEEIVAEEQIIVEDEVLSAQNEQNGLWGTCKWEITNTGCLTVHPGIGVSQDGKTQSPWAEYYSSISDIYFVEENGKRVQVSGSTAYLFAGLVRAAGIDLAGLDTRGVTDMHNMFEGCASLRYLTNANIDTSNVINMNNLFYGCKSITALDLNSWDVSRVENMGQMFCNCNTLYNLKVSNWNTVSVTNMYMMFSGCSYLTILDVSKWNTVNVKDMAGLFNRCLKLANVDVSHWNTSHATSISSMFSGCEKLETIDLSSFNTSNVVEMDKLFSGCLSLRAVHITSLKTGATRNMSGMFARCRLLKDIDLSGWDTSKVTDMSDMFYQCSNLISINVDGWDTSQVTNMKSMFYQCISLLTLDVSSWETVQVKSYGSMYAGCKSLDMFVTGTGYTIVGSAMFPNPTAVQGKWWSKNEGKWFTLVEVFRDRNNTADSYYSYDVDQSGTSIKSAGIAFDKEVYGWTGGEVKPEVTVTLSDAVLRKDVDYTISYKNNINTGMGQAIVKGIGRYKESVSGYFEISYSAYFRDVNEKTYHVEDICWLANAGITSGWSVGGGVYEFRPSQPVARADMASFLYRLAKSWGLVDDSWRPTDVIMDMFRDVSSSTTPHHRSIWWLASVGISEGWPIEKSYKRMFRPYASVTRQDMAAFLFRLAKIAKRGGASDTWSASASAKRKFVDVDANVSTNHHNEVWWLAQTGVSTGWKVGNTHEFRCMQPVTRQDMAAFLHRMDNL